MSPLVSRTLLSILPLVVSAVICMFSILPLNSNSFNLFSKLLETIPNAPTTIGTTDTLMFHNFFSFLARSKNLSIFSLSLIFFSVVLQNGKIHSTANYFFLLINTRLGDPFITQHSSISFSCFDEISASDLGSEKFSCFQVLFNYLFLSFLFVWWCPLLLFPSTCNFPFSLSVLMLSWFALL